jgi:hypothetical protein
MSKKTTLAIGQINGSDAIKIELVTPPDMPQVVIIRWPVQPTIAQPVRFAEVASAAMKVLASANVALTRLRARKLP